MDKPTNPYLTDNDSGIDYDAMLWDAIIADYGDTLTDEEIEEMFF